MKKFALKTLLACIFVAVAMMMMIIVLPDKEDSYLKEYNRKIEMLENVSSPRIIFVGGSNLCFGLNSRAISDSLGISVVNYGLHAGLGLRFMVDDIRQYVREGDIIVFAPEYGNFFGNPNGESRTWGPFISDGGWKKLYLLNIDQMVNVITGIPAIVLERIGGITENKNVWSYRMSGFNEFGDEVAHWKEKRTMAPKPSKPEDANLDEVFGSYFISQLDSMSRKAKVLVIPPVICRTSFISQQERADVLDEYLREQGYAFLSSPNRHALPDSCIFNSVYHMNKSGVDLYTAMVIEEIKGQLIK